nr:MAG TPA: hypothetical protein [Caudoviricetes sp.]
MALSRGRLILFQSGDPKGARPLSQRIVITQ